MKTENRLLALDVFRGITIAGMILVNDPGSWSAVYAPLCHASWNGLTPTDLVFPFFMFIMGISMYFSLRRYNSLFSRGAVTKIFRRAVLIFLIGLGINWFALGFGTFMSMGNGEFTFWERFTQNIFPVADIRILGVLQRLALAYLGGAILCLGIRPRYQLFTAVMILVGYFVILVVGEGFIRSEHNILSVVDRAVLGVRHLYGGGASSGAGMAFDPEGLLSTLPCFAHVLFGVCMGRMLGEVKENEIRIRQLFIFGTILLFAGYLWSYACPVNKRIWSPTYVLISCGAASLHFALLIYWIDVKGYKRGCRFFEVFGVNPLFIYVWSEIVAIVLAYTLQDKIYTVVLASWLEPYFASLVYALLYVMLNWGFAYILYKRHIYIKI